MVVSYCKYLESDYIYVNDLGAPYQPNFVSQHFRALLEKNQLRVIRFHNLRHTCASLLLKNGVSMKEIQEWLGHSNFSTTANIYAYLDTAAKNTSAAKVTRAFSISPGIQATILGGENSGENWSEATKKPGLSNLRNPVISGGAGSRTRTDTMSPPTDFESVTSTNSIIPAGSRDIIHDICLFGKHKMRLRGKSVSGSFCPPAWAKCRSFPQFWLPEGDGLELLPGLQDLYSPGGGVQQMGGELAGALLWNQH